MKVPDLPPESRSDPEADRINETIFWDDAARLEGLRYAGKIAGNDVKILFWDIVATLTQYITRNDYRATPETREMPK